MDLESQAAQNGRVDKIRGICSLKMEGLIALTLTRKDDFWSSNRGFGALEYLRSKKKGDQELVILKLMFESCGNPSSIDN